MAKTAPEETMATPLPVLIDRYCDIWNDPIPSARRAHFDAVMTPAATYTDPRAHTAGPDALLAHIDNIRAKRPGARVLRNSGVDMHINIARFGWHVEQEDGSVLMEGIDIAFLTDDAQKIAAIVGFFGPLPPA